MNEAQKKIMIAVASGLVIAFLFPPHAHFYPNGVVNNIGYSFIANTPRSSSIHMLMLFAEWLGIAVIGGIFYFIARDTRREYTPPQSNHSEDRVTSHSSSPDAMNKYKRWLIRIIGFLFVFLIYALWKDFDKETGTSSAFLRGAFGGISLLLITKISNIYRADKELTIESHHNKTNNQSQLVSYEPYSDEKYHSIALKEIEVNNLSSGLWGKALAYSDGNQDKARAYYLKERANQLMQMHREKLNKSTETINPINELDSSPITPPIKGLFFAIVLSLITVVGVINYLLTIDKSTLKSGNTEPQQATSSSTNTAQDMFQRANDLYSQGRYAEAFPLYQNLADQGDATAQNDLGSMYFNGQSVTQDYNQAIAWYRKAAEQGNAIAQNKLGSMYLYGRGVTKNINEANAWYRKAAEQGM